MLEARIEKKPRFGATDRTENVSEIRANKKRAANRTENMSTERINARRDANRSKVHAVKSTNVEFVLDMIRKREYTNIKTERYCQKSYANFSSLLNMKSNCLKFANKYFRIFQVLGDGNCLFRTISFCLFKNSKQHEIIRQDAVKFVIENWNEFAGFMSGYLQNASNR